MWSRYAGLQLAEVSTAGFRFLAELSKRASRSTESKAAFSFFAARIVNAWNSLPDHVVDVNSLKRFETRLDKFWRDQEMLCLTGPLI